MAGPSQFEVRKLLGEGGFGKVFLIEDKSDPSIQHALKIMDMRTMGEEEVKLALQEINLLRTLEHEHVLAYVTCFREDTSLCIVTEFCPNGDLSDYIEQQQGKLLEETRLITWFRQISSAVAYLHSKNIIHRDLKVQNVFLDANMDCKLGDLGIARMLDSATDFAQTQVGTYHYMSPEIYFACPYNYKTDIWSLAIVIYELATLEKPFDAFTIPALMFKVTHGQKPDMPTGYRPEFGELLSKMMEKDPDDRPSASDIVNDKLFKKTAKPKPMPNLRTYDEYGSADYDVGPLDMKKFLQTISDMCGKGNDGTSVDTVVVPVGKGAEAQVGATPDSVMDLVTRTLTDMGHNTIRPAGIGHIEHQVKLLKVYILNVLSNDQKLFDKADRELDAADGEESLEEKLIRILGHERFGMCGVELLHYKNFTYNLKQRK